MDTKDERTTIKATGPGTTRTLQMGSNDPQPVANAGGQNPPAQQPPKEEMKLTIVDFNEELDIKDQKGILQEAKYRGYVVSYNIPTEDLSFQPVSRSLPARSIYLQCNDHLIVSSYRAKGAEESERKMRAVGGATVRTDDYEGLGSAIDYDGTMLILSAYPGRQATMYKVENSTTYRDYQKGDPLKYNTKTGQFAGDQSFGGEFNAPPRKP